MPNHHNRWPQPPLDKLAKPHVILILIIVRKSVNSWISVTFIHSPNILIPLLDSQVGISSTCWWRHQEPLFSSTRSACAMRWLNLVIAWSNVHSLPDNFSEGIHPGSIFETRTTLPSRQASSQQTGIVSSHHLRMPTRCIPPSLNIYYSCQKSTHEGNNPLGKERSTRRSVVCPTFWTEQPTIRLSWVYKENCGKPYVGNDVSWSTT